MANIQQELRRFVVDNFLYGEEPSRFSDEDSFLEMGLIDSMGILSLVGFVQERFALDVEDAELIPENWDSIDRIARFIQTKQAVPTNHRQAV